MSRAGIKERAASQFATSRWASRSRCRRGRVALELRADGKLWRLTIERAEVRDAAGAIVVAVHVEQRGARRRSERLGAMRRCGFVRMSVGLVTDAYTSALRERGLQAVEVER